MAPCKVEGPSSCSMYQWQVEVCGIEQDKFSQWGMSLTTILPETEPQKLRECVDGSHNPAIQIIRGIK